jgi:hypothetical protein
MNGFYGRCRILSHQAGRGIGGPQLRICPSCHAPLERDEMTVGDLFSLRLIAAGGLLRNRRQLPIQIVKLLGRQRGIEQMREVFALNGILDGVIKI